MPATTMTSRITDADEIVVTETVTKVVSKIVDYKSLVEKVESRDDQFGEDWDADLDNCEFYKYGLQQVRVSGYGELPHDDIQGTRACSSYVNRSIGIVYFAGFNAFGKAYSKHYSGSKHERYTKARECGISAAERAIRLLEDQDASPLIVSLEYDTGADVVSDCIGSGCIIEWGEQEEAVKMLSEEYVLPQVVSQLEDLGYTVINKPLPFELDIKARALAYARNRQKTISKDVLDKFLATRKEK